jgi:hypothetical protein
MDANDNNVNISLAYDIMTLYNIVQQLLLLDHDQWNNTLSKDF